MANEDSAPVSGQPEVGQSEQGQPDWAAERSALEQQLAEYRAREERYKQQITGSQTAFQTLKESGYQSWDEAIADLQRVSRVKKSGLDLDRLSLAFEDEKEDRGMEHVGFDPDAVVRDLAPRIKQQLAEEQRNERIVEIASGLSDAIKDAFGDMSERELRIASGFVRDVFFDSVADQSVRPDAALERALDEYRRLTKEAENESAARRAVEIADNAHSAPKAPQTRKGGMGAPENEPSEKDDIRSRLRAQLERKYQKLNQEAVSRSE